MAAAAECGARTRGPGPAEGRGKLFSLRKGPVEAVAERQDEFPSRGNGGSECGTPAHGSRDGERSGGEGLGRVRAGAGTARSGRGDHGAHAPPRLWPPRLSRNPRVPRVPSAAPAAAARPRGQPPPDAPQARRGAWPEGVPPGGSDAGGGGLTRLPRPRGRGPLPPALRPCLHCPEDPEVLPARGPEWALGKPGSKTQLLTRAYG